MNEEVILKMVNPYLREKSITYYEFDNIFSFLSRKEQYLIADILYKNDIYLWEDGEENFDDKLETYDKENTNDDEILKQAENIINSMCDTDDTGQSEEFKILYDDEIFLDNKNSENKYIYLEVHKNIKQSNDILCRLLQEGNEQAKQDLCIKNRGLIGKVVNIYGKLFGNDLSFEDLEQAGMIGLLKAANRYDYTKGFQFSTYATWWIRQSITREIDDTGFAIRIPVHQMESISKVTALDNRFTAMEMDFQQRIEAIQAETDYTAEKIMYCLMLRNNYLSNASLNAPVGEDQDIEIQDMICDYKSPTIEEIIESRDLQRCLLDVLETLTKREKNIMILRFGLEDGQPETLEEIGNKYNVTRERIRQIEAKALRKLRHPSRSRKLKEFLY